MRGTLHLLAAEDARWMCRLLSGRAIASARARFAQLEITDAVVGLARDLVVTALEGGAPLSRPALYDVLRAGGVTPDGQRGVHLLARLCQLGLLCQGPLDGRQPTFVLIDEWVPASLTPGRAEAMATLAERYVRGHGPATERDFSWWCGQPLGFAREALHLAGDRLVRENIGGVTYLSHVDAPSTAAGGTRRVHLLPAFDEFLLGYTDRSAALDPERERRLIPGGNGVFVSSVVAGGSVVGMWRRRTTPRAVTLEVVPLEATSAARRVGIARAATAYGRFLGRPAEVRFRDI